MPVLSFKGHLEFQTAMMTGIFVDSFFNFLIHFYRKWGCWAMQAWMANNIIFKQLQKNITVFLRSKMISKVAKV